MKKKTNTRRNPVTNNIFGNVVKMRPLTETQSLVIQAHEKKKNIVIYGYPGTGKTWLACACGVEALMKNDHEEIRIIRSAVSSRDMGFLPGSEDEKMAAYERPYIATINSILKRDDAYGLLKSKGMLAFESSSFLRGMTYDNSFIIVDEFQNMSFEELNTIITRVGENTRIIFLGDIRQCDLDARETGFSKMKTILHKMHDHFTMLEMLEDDIVRSDLVKQYIIEAERMKNYN